ncbi:MAG: 4-(cytidine 5'-diphospho)-2-C-methyl-D-erythritol kinase [Pseudomonadota bacterium]|nr:4-(cytidine 5'-diphospho)-2-C-methyl-D-erythritol kinase [Pseudomonadota bacterium]
MIREIAPAKINLALHVRRRRDDGYHDIETLFAFATDGDVVTVALADEPSFAITGEFAAELSAEHAVGGGGHRESAEEFTPHAANLVIKARDAFRERFAIPHRHAITLDKNLPIASGIGGGSADAAATLRALARLHAISLDDPALHAIAADLGADVPACLRGRTTFGTGKGDTLVDIPGLAGTPLLLVNPRVPVSTAAVFAGWDRVDRGAIPDGDLLTRARAGRNDLETSATTLAPVIAAVIAMLGAAAGVRLARMSGSGATCFALFDDTSARDAAAESAAAAGWWTLASVLG